MSTWLEKQIGIVLTAIGILWAAYYVAHFRLVTADVRLGPTQVALLGMLTWLHGKFGRANALSESREQ
jgi:hypothetical protein